MPGLHLLNCRREGRKVQQLAITESRDGKTFFFMFSPILSNISLAILELKHT